MTLPHASGIYKILCVPTGKIYIGSAVDLWDRWRVHHNDLTRRYGRGHHSRHLQRAWDKYGEDAFVFSVLEFVEPERLIEVEQAYIDRLHAADHRYGFNISPTAQSSLGVKHSAETRAKLAAAGRGRKHPPLTTEQRRAISERNKGHTRWLGRKHRPESIEKMRQSKLGKPEPPNAARAKVEARSRWYIVTDPEGNEMLIKNLAEFCRQHGLTATSMSRLAYNRHGVTQHKGWKCRFP